MRISIVIPTRERAETLGPCLDTVLGIDDPDLEVVVSDNCSADGTGALLDGLTDTRLKVVRPPERVSMRLNFETALDGATGDYVIFIGDDDGVLGSGLAMLREILARDRPEAVNWELLAYTWPGEGDAAASGMLPIKYKSVYGGIDRRAPAALLDNLCRARLRNYKDTANIYHGCVARSVIDRVRAANGGVYFGGAIPDVYTGIANLLHMERPLFWIQHPVTFGGASERSNGAAQMSATKVSAAGTAEKTRFKSETTSDAGTAEIDVNIPSVEALTLDMLRLVNRHHAENRLQIDQDAWFARILRRLSRLPRERWEHGIEALKSYAEASGMSHSLEARCREIAFLGPEQVGDARPRARRPEIRPMRVVLADAEGMRTVRDAADALGRVLGGVHRAGALSIALRPFRWIGAVIRLRRLARAWDRSGHA